VGSRGVAMPQMKPCPSCNGTGWKDRNGQPCDLPDKPSKPCEYSGCENGYVTDAEYERWFRLVEIRLRPRSKVDVAESVRLKLFNDLRTEGELNHGRSS